jgi:glycopeptide antibiotics resistance protein
MNSPQGTIVKSGTKNTLTVVLLSVYLLLLTGIVLFKLPFYSESISDGIRVVNIIPLGGSFDENGDLLLREILNNTLLFIPLGIYICILKSEWSFFKRVLTVMSLTTSFEALQFVFALGRSDITDVLDNTLGGIIGIGIYALLYRLFKGNTIMIVNITALVITLIVAARFTHLFYLSHFMMLAA